MCGVVNNLLAMTMGTILDDNFAATTALVACHLALREHAREYLLFHDFDTCSIAA
jgi:hypothetical protein